MLPTDQVAIDVYQLRPFRNSDPPHLADIWRSQPPQRGLLQPVSSSLLEYGVFSKAYFDPEGMIVATCEGQPIGFVHAGFGPNEEGSDLDTSLGTTHLLMLSGGVANGSLANDLLAASEEYLRSRGATVLYAGGIKPLISFYLGLYGGSEIPGVLESNLLLQEVCRERGYDEVSRVNISQCDLAKFRAPVSHQLRTLKRQVKCIEVPDPPSTNWWEACVWGSIQRDRFQLVDRKNKSMIAEASFWDLQPLSSGWGICTAGLIHLQVEPEWRRKGCATFLLEETFRELRRRGAANVEVQTMQTNEAATALYQKLGFTEIDHGTVFRKLHSGFRKQPSAIHGD